MITVNQLINVTPGDFQLVASAFQTAANGALDSLNTVTTARGQLASWRGPASQSATTALGVVTRPLSQAAEVLDSIPATVSAFVTRVQNAHDQLLPAWLSLAGMSFQGQPFTCDDSTGKVTCPPPPQAPPQPAASLIPATTNPLAPMLPPPLAQAEQQAQAFNQLQAGYEKMCQQAMGYEKTIQQALADATSADAWAAGVLAGRSTDGADLSAALAGGPGAAGAMANLTADAAPINAADVKGAQALIAQAKGGNQQSANALMQGQYAELAKDPLFATSLLNGLGPKGLLNVPYGMSHNLSETTTPVLQFLSRALATGTAGVAEGVGAGGTAYTVGSDYLSALNKAGSAAKTPNEPGYWSLGQILGAASTPYSTGFAVTVGQAMINWDNKSNNQGKDNVGPESGAGGQNSDPLQGLMTALAVNGPGGSGAPGAEALFTNTNGAPVGGNLKYLIQTHDWQQTLPTQQGLEGRGALNASMNQYRPFGDNGAALGAAILNATTYGGADAKQIAGQAIYYTARGYEANGNYGAGHSGLTMPLTTVLSDNMPAVNVAINASTVNSASGLSTYPDGSVATAFGMPDLARLVGVFSQNPSAAQTLQSAQLSWLKGHLNNDAVTWKASGDPQQFLQDSTNGTATLSFFARSKAAVAQDGANQHAQDLVNGLNNAKYGAQLFSLVPVPELSIPAGLVSSALADAAGQVHASQAPTYSGDAAGLSVTGSVNQLVAHAVLTNGLNTAQYLPDPSQGQQSYLNSSGQLVGGNLSQDAQNSLSLWLAGDNNPNQQNLVLPGTQNGNLASAIQAGGNKGWHLSNQGYGASKSK
ncbi:MAG: hypothetical protein M3Y91_03150 [Actinomycetota bacterium]|nr:hypothetical protein [Actinomycetota bacterium]